MAEQIPFATTARPTRRRAGPLANVVLAAGLMLLPSQAVAQGKAQKPAETQQVRRQQNVVVGTGDVLSTRSGKTTFQLRITGVYRKSVEFAASSRSVESGIEGGNKKEYVKEWKLETSVEYDAEFRPWGDAFPALMKAVRKGNGVAVLEIKYEEDCPELKKAAKKKTPSKGKKVKEGSI